MGSLKRKATFLVLISLPLLLLVYKETKTAPSPPFDRASPYAQKGGEFRAALLKEKTVRSHQSFLDFTALCQQFFVGLSLQQANLMMRGAGQELDLLPTRQPASLIPPGTMPFGGGMGLHTTMISNATFSIIMYVKPSEGANPQIVADVSCGIKEVSL
jgi:hypothetical protein